jgi:hypothetical protein
MKKSTRRERAAAHRAKREKQEEPTPEPKRSRRASSSTFPLVLNLVLIAVLILATAFCLKKYRRLLAERELAIQASTENPATPEPKPAAPDPEVPPPVEEPVEESVADLDPDSEPELPPLPDPAPETPPEPAAPPETLTPAQSLIRLRADLAAGKRDTMPVGTVRRGESDFFLVTTPMTWAQANGFADAYGGHLPLASRPDDLGWLAGQLAASAPTDPARSSLWIGGRAHGQSWHSIDGEPMSAPPAGEGGFAAIGSDGTLHARGDADRHPFYIQWQRDGSNPASLRAVMARTKASLKGPAASYPPGTLIDGERHLLIVARAVNASDARELAAVAGGHLMVPATPAEADWLAREIPGPDYSKGLWLGATLHDAEWKWDSGEAWTFGRWDPAIVPGEGTALLFMPGAGWRAADPATETSGFIVEWSRDSATPTPPPTGESPDDILTKARDFLAAADKQRATELAENARTFVWSLDTWLRTNNKGEIARWKPHVEALKARINENRVPRKLPEAPNREFSDRMLKIAHGCLDKQANIDAAFTLKAGRARDAYAARLRELAAAEEQRGQPLLARKLTSTATAAADLEAWLGRVGDFGM